jgi:hypothetical protein
VATRVEVPEGQQEPESVAVVAVVAEVPRGRRGLPGPPGGGEASSPWSGEGLRQGGKKAFSKESAGLKCTMSAAEVEASSATRLTFGTSTLFVGFQQIGNNQDPVFIRVDAGEKVYCEHHEKEPPDGRALGLVWDGGATAYVIYTVVGGGTVFDQKARTRWLDRYGDGGGSSKASFLGEVDVASGDLRHGTFIIAKKKDGKTNTHNPADAPIPREDGRIEFLGDSAFQPMKPDKTIMECTGYPFFTRYIFSSDLTTLTCSSSTSCTAKSPCEEE